MHHRWNTMGYRASKKPVNTVCPVILSFILFYLQYQTWFICRLRIISFLRYHSLSLQYASYGAFHNFPGNNFQWNYKREHAKTRQCQANGDTPCLYSYINSSNNEMKHAPRVSLVIAICLHSVSDIAEQAPLALSNVKATCKHGLWLIIRVN